MSFGVREPERVARVLAELMAATALKAPTPPFPHGAWFVVVGDAHGSLLEILPAAAVFDPNAPLAFRQRTPTFEPVSAHVLVSAAVESAAIQTTAAREGWGFQEIETGLFKVMKVWIDGNVLVEFLTKTELERYAEAFGTTGLPSLDGKFRDMEAKLATAFAQKLSPKMLEDSLGRASA